MPEFTEIPPATVYRWIGDGEAVLVDVREADELVQARLEEAVHVPMSAFDPVTCGSDDCTSSGFRGDTPPRQGVHFF